MPILLRGKQHSVMIASSAVMVEISVSDIRLHGKACPTCPRGPLTSAAPTFRTYGVRRMMQTAINNRQIEAIKENTKRLFRCNALSRNERHFVMRCRLAALQRASFSYCVRRAKITVWGPRLKTRVTEPRMYTLYSMQRSGNCYKVRLALAQLAIPHALVEVDILKGETPHAGFPRQESERPDPAAGSRARPLPRRVERDPVVPRGRHASRGEDAHRARRALQWMFFEQHAIVPSSALPISGCAWSRAAANCSTMRSTTGWRKAQRSLA